MRKVIILFFIIVLQQAFAQEQTLITSGKFTSGGFGAPVLKYTNLNEKGAMMIGGRGGWVINHSLVLGGGMYGLVTAVPVDVIEGDIIEVNADNLRFGYGGFEIEYILSPMKMFHVSIYTLLGAGSVAYRNDIQESNNKYHDMGNSFFVAEPAVNLEVNVTTFFHLGVGVSYRFTNGVNYQLISDKSLSGFNGMLTFKFGKF